MVLLNCVKLYSKGVSNVLFATIYVNGSGKILEINQYNAVNTNISLFSLGASSLQLFNGGSHEHRVNGRLPLAPGSPASYLKVHKIHVVQIKCFFSDQRETPVWFLAL